MNANTLKPWNVSPEDFPVDGSADQKLLFMLNFAILAPSSHNTQPWLFRLNGHEVDLFADRRRSLRVVDPLDRELIMSCGAALHHLRITAAYFSHAVTVEYFPDAAEPDLLARVSLGLHEETNTEQILMFNAVRSRRTNRGLFQPDPIPDAVLEALQGKALEEGVWLHVFTEEDSRYEIADLVAAADREQWRNKEFRRELANWITPNRSLRTDGIPGYAQGVGDIASEVGPLLVRTFDRGSGQAAKDREIAIHSPVLAVLGTQTDSKSDWLQAGQALSAVLLRARVEDVWGSFLNQAVEIASARERLSTLTGREGFPQLLLRLGFGREVSPTPRRPVPDTLLKSRNVPIRVQAAPQSGYLMPKH